jgi:hypothetical protein
MMLGSPDPDAFILSAFDYDQWCPVLEVRFSVDNFEAIRSILGEQANDDLELRGSDKLCIGSP